MAKYRLMARSAITGLFVTMAYARKHPKTCVIERVICGSKKKRK